MALITPPIQASGGIGRMMASVLDELSAERHVAVRVLDTRGLSRQPALSVFPLLSAWARLVALALTRRVDVAHVNMSSHGSTVRKPLMVWTCWVFRVPVVLHLHASSYAEFFNSLPAWARRLVRATFRRAHVVVALGTSWREYICNELRVTPEKVVVLPNASPGPSMAVPLPRGGALNILFLGRLGKRKGVPWLLTALADPRLRREAWTVTLAGDGDADAYRAQARQLGISDRLTFPGWVDEADVARLLRESHVLVLPSLAEGLPVAVIEAFAHALAVIATPVGAIPDVLEDGVNGLMVEPEDSAALAEALLLLLRDDQVRSELGERGRQTWSDRLTISSYAGELRAIWDHAAGRQA